MSTLWITLKRAVEAEMPRASVITETAANPRLLARVRMAYRRSWKTGARARSRRVSSVIPRVGRSKGRQGSGKLPGRITNRLLRSQRDGWIHPSRAASRQVRRERGHGGQEQRDR